MPTPEELQRQIAELQAQLASLQKSPSGNATASDDSIAIHIAGSVFGNVSVHTGMGPAPKVLLAHYLDALIADCQRLKLDVIDEKNTVDAAAQLRLGRFTRTCSSRRRTRRWLDHRRRC